jgi:uncharacterized protein YndB with AHSA1/START domain
MIAPDTLRFERKLKGPIERVWAYLTESEKRGKWLAKGEMELVAGGKVSLNFLHSELSPEAGSPPEKYKAMENGHSFTGTVLRVEAPRLLSFTWEGGTLVTFELEPLGDEVLLIVTHRKLPASAGARISVLGGWHTHLHILQADLEGRTPPNFWKFDSQMEERYGKRQNPVAETGMLIRKPAAEVYEAFVDPNAITQFWFTRSSGRLEKGKTVEWIWDMYSISSRVVVKDLVPGKKIEIEWGAEGKARTRVEWTFEPVEGGSTFVNIVNDGFAGDEDAVEEMVVGSTSGFCWVLAGAKAWLEFGVRLNLVGDRFYGGRK